MDAAEFDDLASELVDNYLLFLRGRGPEPDLSGLSNDQRRRLREQFAIVAALADRAPELPPLDSDPVAIRLGLADPARAAAAPGADPVAAVLRELELRFDRQVAVDYAPAWKQWQSVEMSPVAQCSALGNSVALFTTELTPLTGEPAGVAVFLRQYPDISAVCLSSPDAR